MTFERNKPLVARLREHAKEGGYAGEDMIEAANILESINLYFRELVAHCEECGDDSTAFFNAKAFLVNLDAERKSAAFNATYDANARRRNQYI